MFYYLISSLPMLELNSPMPMSVDEFLSSCADWISEKELTALTELSLVPTEAGCNSSFEAIRRFNIWELALRNKLYGIRSAKLGRQQAEEGLLGDLDWFSEIESGVQNAVGQSSPMEKERVLDQLRWNYLGDLTAKEPFAFGQLVVYKLQLEMFPTRYHL
jgi:hypothetical protein